MGGPVRIQALWSALVGPICVSATKDACLSLKIYLIDNYHWNTASIVYEILVKISNVHLSYMK